MKWIGQHIWDFISRFRTTVYLENLETSSDENVLVVDSDGKITKNTSLGGADLTYNGSTANGVLTYGGASVIDVESTLTYDGSALNNITAPSGAFLGIDQRATTTSGWASGSNSGVGFSNIFNKDDNTASGETNTFSGLYNDFNDTSSTNVGTTVFYGVTNFADYSNANGTSYSYGVQNNLTGGDIAVGIRNIITGATIQYGIYNTITDGQPDLKFASSASALDYFTLATGVDGETTFTTVENGGGSTAHMNFVADGDIILDSASGIIKTGTTTFVNNTGVVQVATQGTIDHDSLANFVAAEHYDWASDISGTATIHTNNITDLHGAGVDSGTAGSILSDDADGSVTPHPGIIASGAATTGSMLAIDAGAVTTGNAIKITDATYQQSNALLLDVTDTATTNTNRTGKALFNIDYERPSGSPVTSGQTVLTTGATIRMDDNATNVGTSSQTGLNVYVDNANNGGTVSNVGIQTRVGGSDSDVDIKMINDADDSEYVIMNVTAGGRLIIATTSDDTTGHLILDADGDIEINADGGNITFKDSTALIAEVDAADQAINIYGGSGEEGRLQLHEDSDNGANYVSIRAPQAMASSKVIAFPDVAGTVALTSNIPDETISEGTHIYKQVKVELDTADCNDLNSTPIELIAAQGSDTIICVNGGIMQVDRAANQTNSLADLNFHYADQEPGASGTTSLFHLRRFMYGNTSDITYQIGEYETAEIAQNLTDPVNKAVEVSVDSALTNNCITSITIYLNYYVIDVS